MEPPFLTLFLGGFHLNPLFLNSLCFEPPFLGENPLFLNSLFLNPLFKFSFFKFLNPLF
ncbi:hypothetical protein HMPREF1393_01700 [Helicobacter pylori GAM103Bi]|nr:hypothetical protein HMPREF1393_01700 [Helicobacter pylori GAM103Bi]